MQIVLTITGSTDSSAQLSSCSSGLSKVKCTVAQGSSSATFTLSNIDDEAYTIPKQTITLQYWIKGDSAADDNGVQYNAKVKAAFYQNVPGKASGV